MSETLEMTGKVKFIGETERFASGFQKRLFVLTLSGDYENDYAFELMKERVDKIDGVNVGDEITVKYNLGRANEHKGKWYSSAHTAWYVGKESSKAENSPSADSQCGSWSDDKGEELPMGDDLDSVVPF